MTMTEKRKAFEEKLDSQLKEWNAEIALLKAKAKNTKTDLKVDYTTKIDSLQRKHDTAKAKLHELKSAGDEAWEDLKIDAEKTWDEVKDVFHDTAAKFKQISSRF